MDCQLTENGREVVEEVRECYTQDGAGCERVANRKGLSSTSQGEGSVREVFVESTGADIFKGNETCVVKIAQRPGGKYQNMTEVEVTEEAKGTPAEDMIVPVGSHGEPHSSLRMAPPDMVDWVTMPFVSTGDISHDDVTEWRERMRNLGWRCRDFKKENFGKLFDGTVKMLDYGDDYGCKQTNV